MQVATAKAKRPSIKDTKDWFDVEHVRDALRFRTPVQNLNELPTIVKAIKEAGFEIVKPDLDKLLTPKGRGWRMVALDLRAPNGQIVEYQVLPSEMYEAGKAEHQFYKTTRGLDVNNLTPEQATAKLGADKRAIALYRDAFAQYLQRTGQTEAIVREILDETKRVIDGR